MTTHEPFGHIFMLCGEQWRLTRDGDETVAHNLDRGQQWTFPFGNHFNYSHQEYVDMLAEMDCVLLDEPRRPAVAYLQIVQAAEQIVRLRVSPLPWVSASQESMATEMWEHASRNLSLVAELDFRHVFGTWPKRVEFGGRIRRALDSIIRGVDQLQEFPASCPVPVDEYNEPYSDVCKKQAEAIIRQVDRSKL